MLSTILTAGKTVIGFAKQFKTWIGIGTAVAVVIFVIGHIALDKARIKRLAEAGVRIETLEAQVKLRDSVNVSLTQRISRYNLRQQKALEAAAKRVKAAEDQAEAYRLEKAVISEELGVARFNVLEAIRDDEDMADWVDLDVPVVVWDRLRQTAGN